MHGAGFLDSVNSDQIIGWAWDPDRPDLALEVEIYSGNETIVRLTANRYRKDLVKAGKGTGRYGFSVGGLGGFLGAGRHLVGARITDGGAEVGDSPRLIEVEHGRTTALARRHVDRLVGALVEQGRDADGFAELYTFLACHVARMIDLQVAASDDGSLRADHALDLLRRAGRRHLSSAADLFLRSVVESFPPLRVAPVEVPVVSVVIPALNNFELTYRCIESICAARADTPFEIVLVDDGSCDETIVAEFVFGAAVAIVRKPATSGFVGAANAGAARARGRLLVFLNNDTEVFDGWLDELVQVFDDHPDVGIAGSKLLNEDGTLQEAGGIVWRLGDAAQWGRGDDPEDPRYCFLRDADYVSGAALAVPRELFASLGGFDDAFAPGYYEDTDFCFRIRAAGKRVVVQPLSRVMHKGGATAGTSTDGGMKRHQIINQRQFAQRWRTVLADHLPSGQSPARAVQRLVTRRALFIDLTVLTPNCDAGSNAALGHIRLLMRLGYQVTFVSSDNHARIDPFTADLQRMGVECTYAPQLRSVEEVCRRMREAPPDLIYLHRVENARAYRALARGFFPTARIVYSVADLHFLRTERQAASEASPELAERAVTLRRDELEAVAQVDRVIVHSSYEAALLRQLVPAASVHVVPWPVPVVDGPVTLACRSGIALVGGFNHPPNRDAALRLALHVLPAAASRVPGLKLLLIGADMPPDVRALASDQVIVVGHVDELAPVLGRVRCTVAPLRYGAGLKGKVLTSMAHGLPCLMSAIAAEGIPLSGGLQWMVGATEEELADKIVELHRDDLLAQSLSDQCLAFVRETYSDTNVLEALRAAVA